MKIRLEDIVERPNRLAHGIWKNYTNEHLRDHAPQCGDVYLRIAEVNGTQICGDDPALCEGVRCDGCEGFSEC